MFEFPNLPVGIATRASQSIFVWSPRRDTYNKNLWKYLVEADEDDEEQEEDLEKETKSSVKAFQLISWGLKTIIHRKDSYPHITCMHIEGCWKSSTSSITSCGIGVPSPTCPKV